MTHYIDAEKLKAEIERRESEIKSQIAELGNFESNEIGLFNYLDLYDDILSFITSLQQEPMPDSTQLIAEWEKEKAVLEQKDFRGDAERMAYNAFLDGFVKGLGYEDTK